MKARVLAEIVRDEAECWARDRGYCASLLSQCAVVSEAFARKPTSDDLARIDEAAAGRRVMRADETVYLIMPLGRPRRFPCGACGNVVDVGRVCGCQEKPKRAASDHVTDSTTPAVRARLMGSR